MAKLIRFEQIKDTDGVFDIISTFKGVIFAYVISAVLLLISAALITYSPIPDSAAKAVVYTISIVSVFLAGMKVAKSAKRQGWICGASAGMMYVALLYVAGSLIMMNFSIGISTVIMLLLGFIIGAAGGIFGVNMGFRKRRR